jgi:hypothetical protein
MGIANELGYDCPEIGQAELTEEEKRNKSQTQAPQTVVGYSSFEGNFHSRKVPSQLPERA